MTSSVKFTVTPAQIDGVLVIEPKVLGDESKWFVDSFNAENKASTFRSDAKFIQNSQLFSRKRTLCGTHFQIELSENGE